MKKNDAPTIANETKTRSAVARKLRKYMLFIQSLLLLFYDFEFITNAPNGLQRPLRRNTLELFPQTLDVNVNGARIAEVIEAPYLVKQLVARKNNVGRRCKMIQQLHLFGRSPSGA